MPLITCNEKELECGINSETLLTETVVISAVRIDICIYVFGHNLFKLKYINECRAVSPNQSKNYMLFQTVSTRSGIEGNRALETPNEAQSAGVPAKNT